MLRVHLVSLSKYFMSTDLSVTNLQPPAVTARTQRMSLIVAVTDHRRMITLRTEIKTS